VLSQTQAKPQASRAMTIKFIQKESGQLLFVEIHTLKAKRLYGAEVLKANSSLIKITLQEFPNIIKFFFYP